MNKLLYILLTVCGFFAGMCVGMIIGRGGNSFGCNNGIDVYKYGIGQEDHLPTEE